MNSGAPEKSPVPAPLVAPVVLLLLKLTYTYKNWCVQLLHYSI